MEPFNNNSTKALVIVEGERLEPRFFRQFTTVYGINMEVYVVGANIYDLYNELKEHDFSCDIKDVLPAVGNFVEGNEVILQQKFAYTYLVFDFDAHHREIGEQALGTDTVVYQNLAKLNEMADYFTNETDPAIGKLYINYPMMESYRDCDAFFDPSYQDRIVSIDKIARYKSIAGQRKLASVHIQKYTKENFSDLSKMNVYKLNMILNHRWDALAYPEYMAQSSAANILAYQTYHIQTEHTVPVLNTALFISLDYFGNRNGFYDTVVGNPVPSSQPELQPV